MTKQIIAISPGVTAERVGHDQVIVQGYRPQPTLGPGNYQPPLSGEGVRILFTREHLEAMLSLLDNQHKEGGETV